ncbi:MAG: anthranilate phosphoribosyltransferase, partial [Ilumatobacteraceae bacterium]
ADVLEALGVTIDLDADGVAQCVVETGFGFCFAPIFHPAFRHAGPTRREIGIPTAFNLLGPMANPAAVSFMLVGVGDASVAATMAQVLATRGVTRAWVVHGHGGLDELSLSGSCSVTELQSGSITSFDIDATTFGFARAGIESVKGGSPEDNAKIVLEVLSGSHGPIRDIVIFNAAAGLFVAGNADSMSAAVDQASKSIDTGAAKKVLDSLIATSRAVAR